MYTNLYVYMVYRQYMSGKLYWRVKIDGKWTWRPARLNHQGELVTIVHNLCLEEEE